MAGGLATNLSSNPGSGAGSVTLSKVTITGNAANGSGQGGGIYNNGATFNGTYNRIALNTSAGAAASKGMRNVAGTATMQNNW